MLVVLVLVQGKPTELGMQAHVEIVPKMLVQDNPTEQRTHTNIGTRNCTNSSGARQTHKTKNTHKHSHM